MAGKKAAILNVVWWHKDAATYSRDRQDAVAKASALLGQIQRAHGLHVDRMADWDAEKAYRDIFLHFSKRLARNSGKLVTSLRSRGGRGNVYLQDVLCFFRGDEPLCFLDVAEANEVLTGLLTEGPVFLDKWIAANREAAGNGAEESLVRDFLRQRGALGFSGQIKEEVPLNYLSGAEPTFASLWQKSIDLVHERPDRQFDIIEAKRRLNWEALGQALGYALWFSKLNEVDLASIQPWVICRETDEAVLHACQHYGVRVLTVPTVDDEKLNTP